jgi:hypothetical protein
VREKKKERREAGGWAVREEKERGEEKERVGRAQREKKGEKELHSNAFEFEFEIYIQMENKQ